MSARLDHPAGAAPLSVPLAQSALAPGLGALPVPDRPASIRDPGKPVHPSALVITEPLSQQLALLRALAALVVVVHHAGLMLFGPLDLGSAADLTRWYQKLIWLTAIAGQGGVMLFFVLSGYLVGGPTAVFVARGQFRWTDYLASRASRILPVAWAAVALSLGVAAIIGGMDVPDPVAARSDFFWGMTLDQSFEPGRILAALTLTHSLLTELLPTNTSLWTLANEWWYYLCFPCLLLALVQRRWRWLIPAVLMLLLMYKSRQHIGFLHRFVVWMGGAAIYLVTLKLRSLDRAEVRRIIFGLLAAMAVAFIAVQFVTQGFRRGDYSVGLLTMAWLLVASRLHWRLPAFVRVPAFVLGAFSYSVYCFHMPVMLLMIATAGWAGHFLPFDGHGLLACLGLVGASLVICAGGWWLTERHTPAARRICLAVLRLPARLSAATRLRS
ncbi:acyltransferase family protein [Derxia lacustris]|uniref:acyltransferase family protein n=1 Tax=Derxia lacustris TaxID=764842 RepID=UPI000A17067A|nr:acyltransferase [Derxia lacustris]